MARRLRMMIAGSIAVWVPVASAADPRPCLVDLDKAYRLTPEPATESPTHAR